mgnify:CR=1 FL=1
MSRNSDSLATRVVHAGLSPDPTYGSVIPAIHQTSTFRQHRVGEYVEDFDYARSANPTRAALERAIGDLEGGFGTVFSSGMAATHAVFTATCSAGDHAVIPSDLYGGTFRLVDKVLANWGLNYTMVDQTDLDSLAAAVQYNTRLIWVETPTNPLLNVVDISAVVSLARGALVVVDNTFATPYVQNPLNFGVDIVWHSTTKYIGGHSDVIGGAVVADAVPGRGGARDDVGQEAQEAGALDRRGELALVVRARAGQARRRDLAVLADEVAQRLRVGLNVYVFLEPIE